MNVLGIAGSLRAASYNKRLLAAMGGLAPAGMTVTPYERLRDVPPFDADLEAEPPEPVRDLRARIVAADALIIVTPEYNYGVPGVLKNALDWASRPPGASPLSRKPLAIAGAGPTNFGSVRAQLSLRQTFLWIDADVMGRPELVLFRAQDRFDDDGTLIDAATIALVREFLGAFARHVARARASSDDAPS